MRFLSSITVLALLTAALGAQVYSIYPGNPQGATGNNYPFGPSAPNGMRFVNHIPISALDPANPFITDLSFYSPYSGTWSSGSVKVGIGHLPSVVPCPFTFPAAAGGTTIGSFNDLTVMWDSTIDGPLSFAVSPNTWSPLGLPATGRPPFQWNGIDPIGLFIRKAGHSVTGDTRMASSQQANRTYAFTGNAGGCDTFKFKKVASGVHQ